jgi:hypothetical protein
MPPGGRFSADQEHLPLRASEGGIGNEAFKDHGDVVAVFVVSAMASPAASAEPEFVTKAVVGEAVNTVPFTGTLGPTFFEGAKSKAKVSCNLGSLSGEVTGPKSLANIVMTLTGCKTGELTVNTVGKPDGVVETKVLAGTLGGITATVPGIKLYSQSEGKGGTVIEATCGGIANFVWQGEVTGSLAGAAGEGAPTGKLLTALKLSFAQTNGKQKYQGFSEGSEAGVMGQLVDVLNGSPEPSGWYAPISMKTVPSTWGIGVTK